MRKEAQSSFNSHLFSTAANHQNTQKHQHTYTEVTRTRKKNTTCESLSKVQTKLGSSGL